MEDESQRLLIALLLSSPSQEDTIRILRQYRPEEPLSQSIDWLRLYCTGRGWHFPPVAFEILKCALAGKSANRMYSELKSDFGGSREEFEQLLHQLLSLHWLKPLFNRSASPENRNIPSSTLR